MVWLRKRIREGGIGGLALGAALLAAAPSEAGQVTDSAGRTVEVPETVEHVFAAGPPASVLIYVVAPDRLTGWPRPPRPEEMPYIAPAYRDLPELGRLTGRGDTANLEVVFSVGTDLVIDFGSVSDTYVSLADRVTDQTGLPYLLINGRFDETPAALRLVGDALGVPERGEALATYTEDVFAEIEETLAAVPEEERPRVYLARGPDGLETGLKGSINSEIIERAGGRNVAVDPANRGIARVSLEQVLAWDPEVIITWDRNFYRDVWDAPDWAGIQAVREGRVYLAPTAPFGWIDRPPSLNRLIGLQWLAGLFYPERFPDDLPQRVRRFYDLFYHVDIDDRELADLLQWARGRAP